MIRQKRGSEKSSPEYLAAGSLVDSIEYQLQASFPIESGTERGQIPASGHSRSGIVPDGLGKYRAGRDRMADINVVASLNAGKDIANKRRSTENPSTIHLIADFGPRYYAVAGQPLSELARLVVATTALSAEKSKSGFQMIVNGNSPKPEVFDEFYLPFNAADAVEDYDRYTTPKPSKPKRKTEKPATLQASLELFSAQEALLRTEDDAVVVVSDFLTDTQKDSNGELIGFGWEEVLDGLQTVFHDRLILVRMTSPAQQYLTPASILANGETAAQPEMADFLVAGLSYAYEGQQTSSKIANILALYDRTIELDSMDPLPLETLDEGLYSVLA